MHLKRYCTCTRHEKDIIIILFLKKYVEFVKKSQDLSKFQTNKQIEMKYQ